MTVSHVNIADRMNALVHNLQRTENRLQFYMEERFYPESSVITSLQLLKSLSNKVTQYRTDCEEINTNISGVVFCHHKVQILRNNFTKLLNITGAPISQAFDEMSHFIKARNLSSYYSSYYKTKADQADEDTLERCYIPWRTSIRECPEYYKNIKKFPDYYNRDYDGGRFYDIKPRLIQEQVADCLTYYVNCRTFIGRLCPFATDEIKNKCDEVPKFCAGKSERSITEFDSSTKFQLRLIRKFGLEIKQGEITEDGRAYKESAKAVIGNLTKLYGGTFSDAVPLFMEDYTLYCSMAQNCKQATEVFSVRPKRGVELCDFIEKGGINATETIKEAGALCLKLEEDSLKL